MPVIRVGKPFLLNWEGRMIQYGLGSYEVDPAVAEHWYVQAHLEGYVEPPPPVSYAQKVMVIEQAVRVGEATPEDVQKPGVRPAAEQPLRVGDVPEGAFYFAGEEQKDRPMPEPNISVPQRPPPARGTKGG